VNRRKPWVVLLLCLAVYAVWQQRTQLGAGGGSPAKAVLDAAAWARLAVPTDVLPADADVRAVVAGPAGLVAVGARGDDAGAWVSLDGTAFAAVDAAAAGFAGSGVQRADGVALLDAGAGSGAAARYVAVGADSAVTGTSTELDAAVWTSTNGRDWSRAPHSREQLGGPGDQVMTAVTAGGPGLVAVGRSGSDAVAWTSADGLRWTRIASPTFTGAGERHIRALAAFPDGIVAVGSETDPDLLEHPAIWVSTDGTAWARAPQPTPADDASDDAAEAPTGSLRAVLVTSEQVLALGDVDGDAAVWASPNGVTWTIVPASVSGTEDGRPVLGGTGQQSITGVAAAVTEEGLRIVAVGHDGDTGQAWWSIDGYHWNRQALLHDDDRPSAALALTDRFVAVGHAGTVWYLRV
jgi:hypothetical protein